MGCRCSAKPAAIRSGLLARPPNETTTSSGSMSMFALVLTTFRNRVLAWAFSEPPCEDAVEGAGHQDDLKVEVDLQRHGCRERVHVEEFDGVGDGVLDDHAARVAVDELAGRHTPKHGCWLNMAA